jgi:hypothetical protein
MKSARNSKIKKRGKKLKAREKIRSARNSKIKKRGKNENDGK